MIEGEMGVEPKNWKTENGKRKLEIGKEEL